MGESHEEKAERLFRGGQNCAQSVFGAFAEDFGFAAEDAAKVSCGLGGGVGRQREVCGTVTGASLVLGLAYGPDKAAVYPKVQEFCAAFRAETGSIVCRELLAGTGATAGGSAEARTSDYYRKRPCVELVKLSARLLSAMLDK
jgi:C_GCAxxG_C_C family probable redox protein